MSLDTPDGVRRAEYLLGLFDPSKDGDKLPPGTYTGVVGVPGSEQWAGGYNPEEVRRGIPAKAKR